VAIESSDLKRARQTAKRIADGTGAPITEINRVLRSWNLGEFQGRITTDVEPVIQEWAKTKPLDPIPGGESFDQFRQRVLHCASKVMRSYQQGDRGAIAQVTHSRNIRMVAAYIKLGCPGDLSVDMDTFFNFKIPDAGVMQVKMDDLGRWSVRVWDVPTEMKQP
jgi:broad specificity phosphatase PhoE